MLDTVLERNTGSYETFDANPGRLDPTCPAADAVFGFLLASFAAGSTPQPGTWVTGTAAYNCFAEHPPVGGMAPIVDGTGATLRFAGPTEVRFNPWGQNLSSTHVVDAIGFREVKQLGANTIRIHPQFKDMMASCTTADDDALAELQRTVRRAEEHGVYLYITGLGAGRATRPTRRATATPWSPSVGRPRRPSGARSPRPSARARPCWPTTS